MTCYNESKEDLMKTLLTIGFYLFLTVQAFAQFSTFSDDSGTTGTIYNFNNGFNSYQDSRGNTGTIYNYGNGFQSYQFNGPNGTNMGTIYTFPTQPFLNPPSPPLPLAPPFPAPLYPFGQTTQQPLQGWYRTP